MSAPSIAAATQHGDSEYIDGMIEHDDTVGTLLKALDDMGIANNTIVVYSSDNGPHMNTWPDGAMTRFRSEKNTNWEGAFRVPCLVRWPGVIKPGTVTNEMMSHNDWIPTLCARSPASQTSSTSCKEGYTANGINYKVHLDGYDQSAFLRNVSGTAGNNNGAKSARDKFFYSDDDGLLVGLRKGDYKYVFAEQRMHGTLGVWAEPFTKLRLQKIFNLMQDPFERADITSNTFWDWQLNHVGQVYGAMDDVVKFVATFKEFPPRSFPPSFRSREHHGRDAGRHQGQQGEGRGSSQEHRQDPLRRESDDRPAAPAAWHQVGVPRYIPAHLRVGRIDLSKDRGSFHVRSRFRRSDGFFARGLIAGFTFALPVAFAQSDPLPSWNDGAAKKSIIDFVARVTTQGGARFRCRARSASPPSTMTARCGPSSRLLPARLRARPRSRRWRRNIRNGRQAAVQGVARRRQEGAGGGRRRRTCCRSWRRRMPA